MVSELEKMCKKNIRDLQKPGGFGGPFIRIVFYWFFNYGHGGIRCSHVEIEFEKNSKAEHIHAH